ncbi:DUF222 domain-containing protein [Geodermatophilus sp. URMC 62]|uniref:DUF222 domain-containing protein n=1 Tax=Geodermatophilus sp. URMC 62 TaxID=3423414 RepID=UPI00406BE63B
MTAGSVREVSEAPAVPDLASPAVGWAAGPLGEVQAADREISRQTARRARALAAFAVTRPASADRAQGERGAMSAQRWAARAEVLRPVSEWATQELTVALGVTAQRAEAELERSLLLVTRLPRVLAALESGLLHTGHLWCLLEHVAPIAEDALRGRVEQELLDWVARRQRVTTPGQLGDRVRRAVAQHNARDAARDLVQALRERGVSARPERTVGMSAVTVVCTTAEAQTLLRALSAYADALEPDPADARTRGQKMVDCLIDLVLRPGEGGLPPVQVPLTVVASVQTLLGGDGVGEVDGQLVPAEMARQLARAFAGLDPISDAAGSGTDTTGTDPSGIDADAGIPPGAGPAGTRAGQTMGAGEPIGASEPIGSGEPVAVDERLAADRFTDSPGPTDVEGGPVERAAAELSAADFDRWLDELVREAFGDDPAPGDPAWTPGHPPDPAGEAASGPPERDDVTAPAAGSPPAGGWWAAADRAVEDAAAAVHTARLALGAAQWMVATATRADAAEETAWQTSPAGRVSTAPDALGALAAATQRTDLAALLSATAGGGLADRPRIALTDAVSGALLVLTDLPALRRTAHCGTPACRRRPETCGHDLSARPGLRVPAPTAGYRPTAALDRYLRARDRHCRFPGCRRRIPYAGELDHATPHPHGETSAANLAGFCTTHHRGKHQAPGWTHTLTPEGTLTVTTPTGLTAVTTPPPF